MLATYDFKKTILNIGGHIAEGFADGTGIEVDYIEDSWTLVTGIDDRSIRSATNNSSGKFTINLLQSSVTNAFLTGLHSIDRTTRKGIVPVLLKDLNGKSFHSSPAAWVVKPTKATYAKANTNTTWILDCIKLISDVNGIPLA